MECLGYAGKSVQETAQCFPSASSVFPVNMSPWSNADKGQPRCRKPITALTASGCWAGLATEMRDALTRTDDVRAKFYVERETAERERGNKEEDRFFEDITTLYRRQTMLFQKSCEQLSDIYKDMPSSTNSTLVKSPPRGPPKPQRGQLIIPPNVEETPPPPRPPKPNPLLLSSSSSRTAFGELDCKDKEELYSECLYTVLHPIGSDSPDKEMRWKMIEHLRKAFRVKPKRHLELFEAASSKSRPEIRLNLRGKQF